MRATAEKIRSTEILARDARGSPFLPRDSGEGGPREAWWKGRGTRRDLGNSRRWRRRRRLPCNGNDASSLAPPPPPLRGGPPPPLSRGRKESHGFACIASVASVIASGGDS